MAATTDTQIALAQDVKFIKRLQSIMLQQAAVVAAENPAVANHVLRRALAQSVITDGASTAQRFAPLIVNSTNLLAANTTYDFNRLAVVTDASDASILSQISSLWDVMSGV